MKKKIQRQQQVYNLTVNTRQLCDAQNNPVVIVEPAPIAKQKSNNSVRTALIASLIPSIFVLLALIAILVFVVWGRDRFAKMRAKKYELSVE